MTAIQTTVVIDANLSLAQVVPLPYSTVVLALMRDWVWRRARVIVPGLWEYEVTSGLRRACASGHLRPEQARSALGEILSMGFEIIPATVEMHLLALEWAERLGQARAYDAQYLVLAEQMGATLWTADQRLVNRALQLGVNWVRWVGETTDRGG